MERWLEKLLGKFNAQWNLLSREMGINFFSTEFPYLFSSKLVTSGLFWWFVCIALATESQCRKLVVYFPGDGILIGLKSESDPEVNRTL